MSIPTKMKWFALLPALCLCGCALLPSRRATRYTPAPENLDAREWFRDAKFGILFTWGVYSTQGEGEAILRDKKMTDAQYAALAREFNPAKFNAEEWVAMAKFAGVRYISFTAKGPDGLAMYDSKKTDWDVMDATPFKTDVVKALATQCDRQGMKLFLDYSQLDWSHPGYTPRGLAGEVLDWIDLPTVNWRRYLRYQNAQLEELTEGYGPIGGIRLYGAWDRPNADWNLTKTYSALHKRHPELLIGNNRRAAISPGEDIEISERVIPTSVKFPAGEDDPPLEIVQTINNSWGYNKADDKYKTTRELLHTMIRAAGSDANFLMNVAPRPDGSIPPQFTERLREMGNWLELNGESIFGTRGGPMPPGEWGVSTRKGRNVYLHYLAEKGGTIKVAQTLGEVDSAYLFSTGAAVDFYPEGDHYVINIPPKGLDPIDTIIVLELSVSAQ